MADQIDTGLLTVICIPLISAILISAMVSGFLRWRTNRGLKKSSEEWNEWVLEKQKEFASNLKEMSGVHPMSKGKIPIVYDPSVPPGKAYYVPGTQKNSENMNLKEKYAEMVDVFDGTFDFSIWKSTTEDIPKPLTEEQLLQVFENYGLTKLNPDLSSLTKIICFH